VAEQFSCPVGALAAEIEFAIAYTVACNPGVISVSAEPGGHREQFADAIAAMLTERAGHGLSGMTLTGDDTPAGARTKVNRA